MQLSNKKTNGKDKAVTAYCRGIDDGIMQVPSREKKFPQEHQAAYARGYKKGQLLRSYRP